MREFGRVVYDGLKAKVRAVVKACGGLEASAASTRVNRSVLASYYDLKADVHAPIDVIADLEAACGEPIVTRELARIAGYDLVPRDPHEPTAERIDPLVMCAQASERLGKLSADVLEMLADGKLDNHELATLVAFLQDQIRFWERKHDEACRLQMSRRRDAA